jgi:3-hydroxy-9,10-secoandrosta-1,3,5(10)-triene-9,17-dione monooxygenase reductase component
MSIDPRTLRQALGQFATGVTVIAMEVDDSLRALTANSFTSVSLDPPLVLFCLGKGTRAGRHIERVTGFSVNILRDDQQDLSAFFAGLWHGEPPPFSFQPWQGGPRLEPCLAAIGCERHAVYDGGDHWIVVGRVVALHRTDVPWRPLLFFGGRYAVLEPGGSDTQEPPLLIAWAGPSG